MSHASNPLVTVTWTDRARRAGAAPIGDSSSSFTLERAALLVLSQLATFTFPTTMQMELELSAARERRSIRLSKPQAAGEAPFPAYGKHARY
jgi:hypothetical protein